MYIYYISEVSSNLTCMCTRLKNWEKGEVHRAVIVQFCDKYACTIYFKKLH